MGNMFRWEIGENPGLLGGAALANTNDELDITTQYT